MIEGLYGTVVFGPLIPTQYLNLAGVFYMFYFLFLFGLFYSAFNFVEAKGNGRVH